MNENSINLTQFLNRLDDHDQPVAAGVLEQQLQLLDLDQDTLECYQHFDSNRYIRNLIHRSENYEVLLLCFEAGQRTPIHDHAGSACGVKIIQGTGLESVFAATEDGWLYPVESHELFPGNVLSSNDSDTHQLSNLQPDGKRLITMHVYSPPLNQVGNYSIIDNSVTYVRAVENDPDNQRANSDREIESRVNVHPI